MPAVLIKLLIELALSLGVPYLLRLFPQIPASVREIIEDYLRKLVDGKTMQGNTKKAWKKTVKREARMRLRRCYGVHCEVKK